MVDKENLLKLISSRRSIRDYAKPEKIESCTLRLLLESARWAPSATNRQPWKFITVQDRDLLKNIAEEVYTDASNKLNNFFMDDKESVNKYIENITFFKNASCVIFVAYRKTMGFIDELDCGLYTGEKLNMESTILSIGAAIQNLLLTAHSIGLGCCWMTGTLISKALIEKNIGIKQPWNLISMISIGKGEVNKQVKRKNINDIWEER